VPIEAELKACVRDVAAVRSALAARAEARRALYRDVYFDQSASGFMAGGRELRLRSIETPETVRHLLTFKAPAVDEVSGSKPEYETVVADRVAAQEILLGLGFSVAIEFSKHCENYSFSHDGFGMLATLVTVPELDGTFLEVETIVEAVDGLSDALDAVRSVFAGLGIGQEDLTAELYTDAVARALNADPAIRSGNHD
jgi:adenylate cyclase class 2